MYGGDYRLESAHLNGKTHTQRELLLFVTLLVNYKLSLSLCWGYFTFEIRRSAHVTCRRWLPHMSAALAVVATGVPALPTETFNTVQN